MKKIITLVVVLFLYIFVSINITEASEQVFLMTSRDFPVANVNTDWFIDIDTYRETDTGYENVYVIARSYNKNGTEYGLSSIVIVDYNTVNGIATKTNEVLVWPNGEIEQHPQYSQYIYKNLLPDEKVVEFLDAQ